MKLNQILLLALSSVCVGLTACSDNSSSKAPSPAATVEPATESALEATAVTALPVSGVAMGESTVASRAVIPGQSASGSPALTVEEIFVAYPTLADRNAFLSTIDRVVETDARTLDLYAGGVLILSLARGADVNSLVVAQSNSGFAADAISYTMVGQQQDQSEAVGTLFFQMSACKAGTPDPEQGQDQSQDKGKEKEPKPVADVCHSVESTLTLQKVIQKPVGEQDQEQGKGKGKGETKP